MKQKEFIEFYEKQGVKGIRGLLVLHDPSKKMEGDEMIGIAQEDIRKGQMVRLKI